MASSFNSLADCLSKAASEYKQGSELKNKLPALRRPIFIESFRTYQHALSIAPKQQMVSIRRNLGMAAHRVVESFLDDVQSMRGHVNQKVLSEITFWLYEMISNFNFAMGEAKLMQNGKEKTWFADMEQKSMALLDKVFELCLLNTNEMLSFSINSIGQVNSCNAFSSLSCAELVISITTRLYNHAHSKFEEKLIPACNDAARLLNHCIRLANDCLRTVFYSQKHPDFDIGEVYAVRVAVEDVAERCRLELDSCEAVFARLRADIDLEDLIYNQEFLIPDSIWDLIDCYKNAALMNRESNIEEEAVCYSRIGRIYNRLFKNAESSHRYYKRALELAFSLPVEQVSLMYQWLWFIETDEYLREFQRVQKEKEEELERKSREGILKLIKEDIDDLNTAAALSKIQFLLKLYSKYPPKNPDLHRSVDDLSDEGKIRKNLLAACNAYHPDKNMNLDNSEEGAKRHLLCEHIQKIINSFFDQMKMQPDERAAKSEEQPGQSNDHESMSESEDNQSENVQEDSEEDSEEISGVDENEDYDDDSEQLSQDESDNDYDDDSEQLSQDESDNDSENSHMD